MPYSEVIGNITDNPELLADAGMGKTERNFLADKLIANGVTVQEWVSVDDRLPGVGNIVLIYSETDGVCLDSYSDDTFDYFDVTHWMPMPQPPKGE